LTNEWQLLGENDTVPAGAHIRMDLSTGGRWAKLNQEGDDENQVEIDSFGGIVSVKEDTPPKQQDFDYDMMHRALSHLPQDEKERMGGLPEKPGENADPQVQQAFEERMKELWIRRQAELQKLQEESMADLPKILLERIKRLDEHLQDPCLELSQEWKDDGKEEGVVTHVVSVLQDLESHFSDIDVTRDFHTLGGWPLLISLLSDEVHQSPNATLTPEQLEKVHEIQSSAAWAIGTAVKNIGEFAPWATEHVVIDGVKTTPVELLLDLLKKEHDGSSTVSRKYQKVLYALGSLLRGNRVAQAHFCASGGPAVLGNMLSEASQDAASADIKTAKRILALADDIVSDVALHPYEQDEDIDKLVIASFSTDDWCQPPLRLLEQDGLQETALETIEALVTYCKWDKEVVRSSVAKVKEQRQGDAHIVELADSILSDL